MIVKLLCRLGMHRWESWDDLYHGYRRPRSHGRMWIQRKCKRPQCETTREIEALYAVEGGRSRWIAVGAPQESWRDRRRAADKEMRALQRRTREHFAKGSAE